MEFNNKNCLVAGMGISGKGAALLLIKKGAKVSLYDGNADIDKEKVLKELGLGNDTLFIAGGISKGDFDGIDVLVVSPGIPMDSDICTAANEAGVKIIGEIELGYACKKGKLIAITGTNGKTTTTALTGEICKAFNAHTNVVGNIGKSFASVAYDTEADGIIVAEISSFQLETIHEFKPDVSAVLNITPDHLNRHKTLENYSKIKMDIGLNQTKDQVMVLNYEDEYLRNAAKSVNARVLFFSSNRELSEGAYFKDGNVILKEDGKEIVICNENEVQILGLHNMENIMAAVLLTKNAGIPLDIIKKVVREFKAVEHRIEFVKEVCSVKYYNDSKGTNIDATSKAISAMKGQAVLIAGGYDKGANFDELLECFNGKVKKLMLFGATAEKIRASAEKFGFKDYEMCADLKEAVLKAKEAAKDGENVLFSPACASWDMYKNYEERGEHFKQLVGEL